MTRTAAHQVAVDAIDVIIQKIMSSYGELCEVRYREPSLRTATVELAKATDLLQDSIGLAPRAHQAETEDGAFVVLSEAVRLLDQVNACLRTAIDAEKIGNRTVNVVS